MNMPIIMNGMPIPAEYANRRLNASPGVVAASVSIEPKIGPTHGVQPREKAPPTRMDLPYCLKRPCARWFFEKSTDLP